jgi:hypothetical protein
MEPIMKTHSSLTLLLLSLIVASPVMSASKPEKKEDDATRKILSKHITISTYEGAQFRRCRGRTARCPENCGNSGEFARFTINEYLTYEKPGKYGDPKQKQYLIQISDFHKKPKGDAGILKVIKGITKGDKVHLAWNHNYVTRKGSSFPERVVKELKKLESR